MKKVLLGLLALSAVTMAKPSDLTQSPAVGGTVFEATQEGAIGMSGALTSTIPKVKYVVYASKDNGATKEDVLQLADWVISQDITKAGFVGANPKVYVKRVVGGTYGELDPAEIVEFKINHKDYTTFLDNWGDQAAFHTYTGISKVEMEKIIASNPILTGATITDMGHFIALKNKYYYEHKLIVFNLGTKGIITIEDMDSGTKSTLTPEENRAVEDGFKNGIPMNIEMLIRVK